MIEPNPHQARLDEIRQHSRSLNAQAGDLVRLSTDMVIPHYRQRKHKDEPYEHMIERYSSPADATSEFIVLSCGGAARHADAIVEIIKRGYQIPHPCYQFPCPLEKEAL